MSLLDRAINFAKDAYNYVVGNDNEKKPVVKNSKKSGSLNSVVNSKNKVNSVTNPEEKVVGTVMDEVVITAPKPTEVKKSGRVRAAKRNQIKKYISNQESAAKSVESEIKKVLESITQKCKKYGISYEKAQETILSHMEFSVDEFKTLSKEEQLSVLYSIEGALNLYIIDLSKTKEKNAVSKEAYIGETAKNIKLAKDEGGIEDVNEFNKNTSINDIEQKITSSTTDEEYDDILHEARIAFKRALELKRIAEIKRCNGNKEEIDKVNRKYEAQTEAFERQRQLRYMHKYGPSKAYHSVYLRGGKDFADAHATALSLYNGQVKTEVANSFSHDFEVEARRRYYECGDEISTAAYAEAVELVTQNMSWEALRKFEQDAYEFRMKVKNGEVDAPYMTEQDFEAESVALGKGIAANINISDGDKQHLTVKLNNHISNFGNYEKIRILIEESSVKYNVPKVSISCSSSKNSSEHTENVNSNGKATPKQLEHALTVMSYEEAKKQFTKNSDRDFAVVVLHNPKLKGHKQHILGYLKTLSADDLSGLVIGCSTDMFLFVLRNITPDKAGRLYDLSKGEKCYSARKLGEKIIEEGQEYAA